MSRKKPVRALPIITTDPIVGARAFLETQTAAMRQWDNAALPNRSEHETALAYLAALVGPSAPAPAPTVLSQRAALKRYWLAIEDSLDRGDRAGALSSARAIVRALEGG
jgi:hypothetical protein